MARTVIQEDVSMNMTPMIDVTFQLIIFFILVGQMASDEFLKLSPPHPDRSQAERQDELVVADRVIVNVSSAAEEAMADPDTAEDPNRTMSRAEQYKVGTAEAFAVSNQAQLKTLLREAMMEWKGKGKKKEDLTLQIRADWRVSFQYVQPVLTTASELGYRKMNIAAVVQSGKRKRD
ncbi:MAG: ExbD/TolR family protein [Phycisphaerae bacterium]